MGTEKKQEREFKSPRQIAAAKKAVDALLKSGKADAVAQVWKEHFMQVGHKVLGRLLLGKSPIREKKED